MTWQGTSAAPVPYTAVLHRNPHARKDAHHITQKSRHHPAGLFYV